MEKDRNRSSIYSICWYKASRPDRLSEVTLIQLEESSMYIMKCMDSTMIYFWKELFIEKHNRSTEIDIVSGDIFCFFV